MILVSAEKTGKKKARFRVLIWLRNRDFSVAVAPIASLRSEFPKLTVFVSENPRRSLPTSAKTTIQVVFFRADKSAFLPGSNPYRKIKKHAFACLFGCGIGISPSLSLLSPRFARSSRNSPCSFRKILAARCPRRRKRPFRSFSSEPINRLSFLVRIPIEKLKSTLSRAYLAAE